MSGINGIDEPTVVTTPGDLKADLREAYERGRSDERATRKRHPIGMTLLFVAAIVGVIVVALAVVNGSFGRAGGVMDQNLAVAADRAEPAVREAASDAGDKMREAGADLKAKTETMGDKDAATTTTTTKTTKTEPAV